MPVYIKHGAPQWANTACMEETEQSQNHRIERAGKKEDEFNWFEDTTEFGFDDIEDMPKKKSFSHRISKGIIPVSIAILSISLLGLFVLNFIPVRMRIIQGFSLKHIFILIILLSALLILTRLVVHGGCIIIRDSITNSHLLHNKKLKLDVTIGVWFFEMIPLGIHLNTFIPWARVFLDKMFICGFLTILALSGKGIMMEIFREQFLSNTLKDKAKDVEIKNRIVNALREYCYEDESEHGSDTQPVSCFLVSCINDEDENPNSNRGMDFIKGDLDKVIGDMFTSSIFEKNHLTQHEILCLARDVFMKCSKNKEYITFNDFCEIFPNAQAAIQAFLYFDSENTKKLTKKDIRDTLGMFHYNRKNLQTSFNSLNNFIEVLDNLSIIVVAIPLVIIYLIVLGFPIKQLVAFSLSSALILNFFVSSIAKDFCLNASFIITHPFDIGDDVIIDGKSYTIYRTSLYKTEVLGIDGGKISFLNKVLWNKNIINMTRAPQKLIHISFKLEPSTCKSQFNTIKKHILKYLRTNNDVFYETFTIQSESESVCKVEGHNCVLVTRCKSIGSKMAKLELKIQLVKYLKELLKTLKDKEEQKEKDRLAQQAAPPQKEES
ncbi:uncharacterized protein NEMAJ01_1339 [Nematocida major]|uniref:uncharacterized protein n=1 Tax=Nematocida major TaxID=1912982 RepID=UPI0020089854|nr:uncharacterized protein NEMAJ01_1339 [Nematocida major]KAH9386443.1 hypothetical protein NEMAJ01_1339 [Nematocida major]